MIIFKDQRILGWQMPAVLALVTAELFMLSVMDISEAAGKTGMIVNTMNDTMRITGCVKADIPPHDHLQVNDYVSKICRVEEIDVNGTLTGCTAEIDLSRPSDEYFIQFTGVYYVRMRRGKTLGTWDQDWCPV